MTQADLKIAELNPEFVTKDGVYALARDETKVEVSYTDAAQDQVIAVISSFDDASTASSEVDSAQGDGHYINNQTAQFLNGLDLSGVSSALEISNDCGNFSRLFGEQLDSVESLKTDHGIAMASAYRCADLANVSTICSPLHEVVLPKGHFDLIIVSHLEHLLEEPEYAAKVLKKIIASLSENGVLGLISANPKPVSAWFSDQQELPYAGLYGLDQVRRPQKEWLEILEQAGLPEQDEHCFLPQAKFGKTLLAKKYLEEHPAALNHFYGSGLVADGKVNEYLLFTELAKTQSLFDLCDDYLTWASNKPGAIEQIYVSDFVHFSSAGRRNQWRTLTTKRPNQEWVEKHAIGDIRAEDRVDTTGAGIEIRQDLTKQPFQPGQSLAGLWLEALVAPNGEENFAGHLQLYHVWLQANASQYGDALYDILPFNLIVDKQGDYQVIDPEWEISGVSTPEFVLFRALFWFGFHNRHLLAKIARKHGLFSLEDFVRHGMAAQGYDSDIEAFSASETDIQSSIEKQFNQDAIAQTLRLPISLRQQDQIQPLLPNAQLFWCDDVASLDFENSVSLGIDALDTLVTVTSSVRGLDTQRKLLRVDPIDRAGFFHFQGIQLLDKSGSPIWQMDDEQAISEAAELVNAVYCESHLGTLFLAQNDDPQFLFDLSEVPDRERIDSVVLDISYSHSKDYALAMQQLGQESLLQKQFIDQQRNELEALRARFSELNDNFDFLKNVSERQHELIENLTDHSDRYIKESEAALEEQRQQIADQQGVIDAQLEMMQRTPMARFKNFIARMRGGVVEPEPEVEEVPLAEQEPEPVVLHKPVKLGQTNEDYAIWIKNNELREKDILHMQAEVAAMPLKPTFSIVVPVYNIDEEYLMLAIDSVRNQIYPYWELCLVDDASPKVHVRPMLKRLAAMDERIVVRLNKDNQGIAGASNDAVRMTTGDYVALLDHDDEISIDALYQNAKVINEKPGIGFLYSDEDKVTMDDRRVDPFFKPDYSPDLLDSQNYICHFSVISQEVIDKIGGFRLGFDGSQDHDIIMRAIQHSDEVAHIPKVLYHWRKVPGSTAEVYDAKSYAWEAGRKAVQARLEHSGEAGRVELGPLQGTFQVKRDIIGDPMVSIIIPFKDKPELLRSCIDSILSCNDYSNYEILGVSNNSEEQETLDLMQAYQDAHSNISFIEHNVPFNFSDICNHGVAHCKGEYVLLLNNDIEVRSEDWLERLLEHAQRPEVGAVGGKLFFPDGRIQHAGVVAGMHGAAGHSHLFFAADDIGYYGSLMVTRNVSAVTGAMLMVSREKYDEVGGLDADNLAVAYNDVDLCLSLVQAGYRNIYTPFVHAVHHESASRGYEDSPEKLERLERERDHFLGKWQDFIDEGDPCFNPNFDLESFDFKIKL